MQWHFLAVPEGITVTDFCCTEIAGSSLSLLEIVSIQDLGVKTFLSERRPCDPRSLSVRREFINIHVMPIPLWYSLHGRRKEGRNRERERERGVRERTRLRHCHRWFNGLNSDSATALWECGMKYEHSCPDHHKINRCHYPLPFAKWVNQENDEND